MILTLNDLMEDVYKEFDAVEPKALDKICKHGLLKLRKHLKGSNEMLTKGKDREVMKFFIPMTPENQDAHTGLKLLKQRRKNEEAVTK